MKCPKCTGEMEVVEFSDVTVDRCVDCKGIWFDIGEAEKLKLMDGSEQIDIGSVKVGKQHDAEVKIDCPRCQTHMIRMVDPNQPHIHYEGCTVCYGLYLDAGEFTDLKDETIADLLKDFWLRVVGQKY